MAGRVTPPGRSRRSRKLGRRWWATWPGALGLGAISLAMVLATSVPLVLVALLTGPGADSEGTDYGPVSGIGIGWRIAYVVLATAFLAVPVATVWSARRRLLGFLIWALLGSALVLGGGLYLLGFL